jgi:cell division septum initiation protein DivIVA
MLEELRSQVPAEIERGQQIIQTKQNILDNAKIQADKIVEKALKEANETVEEHEIVKLAKRRANDIEQQANQHADDLVRKAKADAKEIRLGAMEYTRDIINSITEYFEVMKEEQVKVHNAHAKLLSEMDSEIEDLKSNSAQMENQIHALANAGMSRPRTIDDL